MKAKRKKKKKKFIYNVLAIKSSRNFNSAGVRSSTGLLSWLASRVYFANARVASLPANTW